MLKKLLMLGLLIVLIIVPLGHSFAQDENSAPIYVRYCNQTRQNQGESALQAALNDVDSYIINVEDFLRRVDSGNLTFIEAVTESEAISADWVSSPVHTIPCLAPLERDVTVMLNEVVIAMLYGLNLKPEDNVRHLGIATGMIEEIKLERDAATNYLTIPLPTPEPEVVVEEEQPEEPVERTPETLSNLMNDYLQQNQISVLREGRVQEFPDGFVITLLLDRFILNGEDLDYDNSIFTMDTLAGQISEWEELADIRRIRIETYDGETLTLAIEASGEAFRGHYVDSTVNRDEFLAGLVVEEVTTGDIEATPDGQ